MQPEIINLQYTTIKNPLPDFIYEDLREYSHEANLYRPQPVELIERIANKHNLSPDQIFLTAGIDEAIQMFAKSFGANTYIFTPTYIVYTDVNEFGGHLTSFHSIENNEYTISTQTIKDATLIFLANPNNPSGITAKEKVMELVRNNPESIVVIDEAYGEFAKLSVIDEVKNHPNMSVLRSFSKGYGMAGNRVGFVVASPDLIAKIKNKTQWCNVSYLSIGAAMSALEHEDYFKSIRDDISLRREEFITFLKLKGFQILPSRINAVLIKLASEGEGSRLYDFLKQKNIITSMGNGNSNTGLNNSYVRIAIGNSEQMDKVREAIRAFLI